MFGVIEILNDKSRDLVFLYLRHRISREAWWIKLRPLLRILAKHESTYEVESVIGKAKEIDHADTFL